MQADILAIAKRHKFRLFGPNCLGLFNSAHRFYPTFTSSIDRATPVPGGLSIASQSGAYGSHIYFMSHLRGLGIRYLLTTGNEADLHVSEAIKLLAESDNVHTIMAYAETIKDGPLLIEALETARANRKPVIFHEGWAIRGGCSCGLIPYSLARRRGCRLRHDPSHPRCLARPHDRRNAGHRLCGKA